MLITNIDQFNCLLDSLSAAKHFAFDTETQGLSPYTGDRIIGLSFGIPMEGTVYTWYVPIRHERGHRLNFDPKTVLERLKPIFADESKTIVGWNAKFDLHFLWVDGVPVNCRVLDAMLAWHLVDENLHSYSLKDVAKLKLGKQEVQDDKDLQTLLKSEKLNKGAMYELSPIEAAPYAESDASLTWRLFSMAVQRLKADDLTSLFQDVCQYARVLEKAERKGLKVDTGLCEELIENAQVRDKELFIELEKLTWEGFNPNSPAQVKKWLQIPSSAKEKLIELQDTVPGISELLEYRAHSKALSGFYLPFRSRRDRFNRVHAGYRLHGTVTGRLSCGEPNLQNLPRATTPNQSVKQMIVAATGYKLLSTDLNQAEFRLMAHYAQDADLIRNYRKGDADMHQFTADELGMTRQAAKTLNFALLYGGGVPTVTKQLSCSESHAKEVIRGYHNRFPGVKKLYWDLQRQADTQGFVSLWTGRRRRFPYIRGVRIETHKAMNSVIQGGVAEIVRVAMTRLDSLLPDEACQIAQVHDECLVEIKNSLVKEVAPTIKEALECSQQFRVPMKADQKIGRNWGQMEGI